MKYFWSAVKDWKIWVYMFITVGVYTPLYSFSLFLPTIVQSMGYQNEEAQLITVPPYLVVCFFCIGGGFLADRQGSRGLSMIFFNVVAIIGFMMLITSDNNGVKYAGTRLTLPSTVR